MLYRVILADPCELKCTTIEASTIEDAVRQLRHRNVDYTAIEWPAAESEPVVDALYLAGHQWNDGGPRVLGVSSPRTGGAPNA